MRDYCTPTIKKAFYVLEACRSGKGAITCQFKVPRKGELGFDSIYFSLHFEAEMCEPNDYWVEMVYSLSSDLLGGVEIPVPVIRNWHGIYLCPKTVKSFKRLVLEMHSVAKAKDEALEAKLRKLGLLKGDKR